MNFLIMNGSSLEKLSSLEDASIESLVCDPPSGTSYLGLDWDGNKGGRDQWIQWMSGIMKECLRVLKPGSHGVVWALPRTSHWTAMACENAGFEIRDCLQHIFATGFVKNHNIGMAIDSTLGVEREKIRIPANMVRNPKSVNGGHDIEGGDRPYMKKAQEVGYHDFNSPEPISQEAKKYAGYGTALKPAVEHYILIRKPLENGLSIASNVLKHGTGIINISACRVGDDVVGWGGARGFETSHNAAKYGGLPEGEPRPVEGRWPPHLLISHAECCSDEECIDGCPGAILSDQRCNSEAFFPTFRYTPKASRREKEAGVTGDRIFCRVNSGGMENDPKWSQRNVKNNHPTCKPVELMRWLVNLVTPEGGTVLDPFMGSGTTGVSAVLDGFYFIGIDLDNDFCSIAKERIEFAQQHPEFFVIEKKTKKEPKSKKARNSKIVSTPSEPVAIGAE